jgi:hypothetical protein
MPGLLPAQASLLLFLDRLKASLHEQNTAFCSSTQKMHNFVPSFQATTFICFSLNNMFQWFPYYSFGDSH